MYIAGPQCRTQASQRRICFTPPSPVWLPAEPPANHTTLRHGETPPLNSPTCTKCRSPIKTETSSASWPNLLYWLPLHLCCSNTSVIFVRGTLLCSPCALLLCVASCQSRPRRPIHKNRGPRDEDNIRDTRDTWDGWVFVQSNYIYSTIGTKFGCEVLPIVKHWCTTKIEHWS